MFIGRMAGWIMVLGGLGLLVQYYAVGLTAGPSIPTAVTEMVTAEDGRLQYLQRSILQALSAMMISGWTAALLIIFGVLLVWGCRRGAKLR